MNKQNGLPPHKKHWIDFKGCIVDLQHGKKKIPNVLIMDVDIEKRTIFYREDLGNGRRGMASGGVLGMVEIEDTSKAVKNKTIQKATQQLLDEKGVKIEKITPSMLLKILDKFLKNKKINQATFNKAKTVLGYKS